MYRLATKCTTKNELTRARNAISVYGTHAGSRLVCQQWHGAVERSHGATADRCTQRTQIRSNCWIRGLTSNGFFIQRSRCCGHNE